MIDSLHRCLPSFVVILSLLAAPVSARTFTDKNGRKLEAEIVGRQGNQVRIRRADGMEFPIPVESLSPADQAYVNAWKPASTPTAATIPTAQADPRVKPGEIVALTFPQLPADLNGNPATCNVRIPEGYDPSKPVPLLVFIAGGKGGNVPGAGLSLVDKSKFAIAALPYPGNTPTPLNAMLQGKMDLIYDYQQVMLAEVQKLLPNLDPKVRIAAGFSNGAHTLGTAIEIGRQDFIDFFNAFVIIEGGSQKPAARKTLRGKFGYLAWGNNTAKKGSKEYMQTMFACAKDARLELTTSEMDGIGHEFTEAEKASVKKWIEQTVIPGLSVEKK